MLGNNELYKKYFLRPFYNPLKIIKSIRNELEELNQDTANLNEVEIKTAITNLNKRKKEFIDAEIKFILTNINLNNFLFRIGDILTTICNQFVRFPYGALHSGLMIDETIIQWGCGTLGPEIIIPSSDLRNILFAIEIENAEKKNKIKSLFTVLGLTITGVAGVSSILSGGLLSPIGFLLIVGVVNGCIQFALSIAWDIKKINERELDVIAQKCVLYNKFKYYSPIKCNCQKFVTDTLEAINAPFNPSGELRNVNINFMIKV